MAQRCRKKAHSVPRSIPEKSLESNANQLLGSEG